MRDGVYLLPARDDLHQALVTLEENVNEADGMAHVLMISSRDHDQGATFRSLFDRSGDYAAFVQTVSVARKTLTQMSSAEIVRLVRRMRKDFEAVQVIDFFPNDAAIRAQAALQEFELLTARILSPGEPSQADGVIEVLDRDAYQGRIWATRKHLWVDRVATAWLIARFVDSVAHFVWLTTPEHCPENALGFDFDGATFTHVGDKVTFEVVTASFALQDVPGMKRLGQMIRALDVGGVAVPEAAGFEAIITGARQRALNDDALLAELSPVLDSLLAHFATLEKSDIGKQS